MITNLVTSHQNGETGLLAGVLKTCRPVVSGPTKLLQGTGFRPQNTKNHEKMSIDRHLGMRALFGDREQGFREEARKSLTSTGDGANRLNEAGPTP